jgi:hypothetical protein
MKTETRTTRKMTAIAEAVPENAAAKASIMEDHAVGCCRVCCFASSCLHGGCIIR